MVFQLQNIGGRGIIAANQVSRLKGEFVTADAIREMLNRRPFEPFEVITSSGERHFARHHDFLTILQSKVAIGDLLSDRLTVLAIRHITELRPIEPQPSA